MNEVADRHVLVAQWRRWRLSGLQGFALFDVPLVGSISIGAEVVEASLDLFGPLAIGVMDERELGGCLFRLWHGRKPVKKQSLMVEPGCRAKRPDFKSFPAKALPHEQLLPIKQQLKSESA
jgi:hypothetical protein